MAGYRDVVEQRRNLAEPATDTIASCVGPTM
jgi:hypothetical protein